MKNALLLLVAIIIALAIFTDSVYSQDFKRITFENGLSSNKVESITQDSTGLIWIGTQKGLNCYNGYDIKTYYYNSNDTNSIADNNIRKVFVTNNDLLIVGTLGGLSIYNKDLDNFSTHLIESNGNGIYMQNYINDISQDKYNNIWVATAEGLIKFNSENYTFSRHFFYSTFFLLNDNNLKQVKEAGIPDYVIDKLVTIDKSFFVNKTVLSARFLTLLGEIDHKKYTNTIINIVTQNQHPFFSSSVNALTIDDNDRIWIGLSNGHIVQTNINNNNYKIAYLDESHDIGANIYSLVVDNNKLWSGSINTGKIFDINSWKMISSVDNNLQSIFNLRNPCFEKANSNKIWIGTKQGLFSYNKKNDTKVTYKNNSYNPNSISSSLIADIYTDKQNQVWIATEDAGLCKMKSTKQFINFAKKASVDKKTIDNKVTAIYIDKNNNILTGYSNGCIDIYNSNGEITQSFEHDINKTDGIGKGAINSIIEDKKGQIWISSYFGGLQKYDSENKKFITFKLHNNNSINNYTSQIVCDNVNNLWVNTDGDGFCKINSDRTVIQYFNQEDTTYKHSLPSNWIKFLYFDKHRNLIFFSGHKLYKLNEKNKTIKPLFNDNIVLNYTVSVFFEDTKGNYYIGTSLGLYLVMVNNNYITDFNKHCILANYSIMGILEDENRNLWVSTNNGLFKIIINSDEYYNNKEITVRQYLTGDGLPNNSFTTNTTCKTKKGKMFFGTEKGFTTFFPDSIKPNLHKPNVILTDFKLYNKSVTPDPNSYLKQHISQTKKITLPHNQNFISFEFVAINYINSEANRYAYKMEGVDNDWINNGNKREANYTKLSHGVYKFTVKASNNDNVWNNEGVSVEITIKPPFWKTKIAMLLYAIAFIALFFLFAFLIKYQEKYKAKMQVERLHVEKDNELNKMKLQFFTNISHEFRTPLTLIIGPLESLIHEGLGNSKQLQLIRKNTKKLLSLIDQILDIRKLNSGKMQLKKEKCEIIEFIKKIVSNFEYQCQSKNINLSYKKNIDKLEANVDSEKIETIINNLISNAIKHTPKNGEILVTVLHETENVIKLSNNPKSIFSISVKDTGRGIPNAEIDNVFERFYQSSQKSNGGSGIGLTLVKELTEMHNGRVVLQSKINEGSTFTVYFPFISETDQYNPNVINIDKSIEIKEVTTPLNDSEIETNGNTISENQSPEADVALPLILVVEDNDDVRDYIISELQNNYRLIDAANGKDAMKLATAKFPDIIISDIMMPEMDGLELCKRLKLDKKTSHIPIILLTAYANETTNIAGYETGAESFLAKPFSPQVLKSRIKNILQNRELLKDKFSDILYSIPTNKSINTIDEQFINDAIKIVEDNLIEDKFNIEFLCREMGYGRTAFYSKIKVLTNQSISEFIKLIRLKKSTELFKNGQKSIKEVAYLVGFKTHSHFTRCFSEEFKMSPTEYLTKIK